jgi:hypothetical protein
METAIVQEVRRGVILSPCAHARLIDTIMTRDGKRSGMVRCLECGDKFHDPRPHTDIDRR